jgi:hypothetical protein
VSIPLISATDYVALVSKANSGNNEVTFSLQFTAVCQCAGRVPEACLGIVGRNFQLAGGLNTAVANSKINLQCGSKQANLRDFAFNFQVAETGKYRVSLINVINGNSTLQLSDCNAVNPILGCGANNAPNKGGSIVEAFLTAGQNYHGVVSKFDVDSQEVSVYPPKVAGSAN